MAGSRNNMGQPTTKMKTKTSNSSRMMEQRWGGDKEENRMNKGPRDVVDISWATGKSLFFSFLIPFSSTTRVF
jgi:hypothetical protein